MSHQVEASLNAPSSGPSRRPLPLKPGWVAVGCILLVGYLLLRPWLVERYGWDLPGFTDAKSKGAAHAPDAATSRRERIEKNRPVDVPITPEQEEDSAGVTKTEDQIAGRHDQPNSPGDRVAKSSGSPVPPAAPTSQPPASQSKPKNTTPAEKPSPAGTSKPAWKGLHSIGRGKFESPAGLVYDQYRIDHVMEHARDNTDKPSHGVFDVTTQDEVLALIDEAFGITKERGPPQVVTEDEGDRTAYTVNLNRKVGRAGGQSGARRRNPPLQKVKIVVEESRVITAYPTN